MALTVLRTILELLSSIQGELAENVKGEFPDQTEQLRQRIRRLEGRLLLRNTTTTERTTNNNELVQQEEDLESMLEFLESVTTFLEELSRKKNRPRYTKEFDDLNKKLEKDYWIRDGRNITAAAAAAADVLPLNKNRWWDDPNCSHHPRRRRGQGENGGDNPDPLLCCYSSVVRRRSRPSTNNNGFKMDEQESPNNNNTCSSWIRNTTAATTTTKTTKRDNRRNQQQQHAKEEVETLEENFWNAFRDDPTIAFLRALELLAHHQGENERLQKELDDRRDQLLQEKKNLVCHQGLHNGGDDDSSSTNGCCGGDDNNDSVYDSRWSSQTCLPVGGASRVLPPKMITFERGGETNFRMDEEDLTIIHNEESSADNGTYKGKGVHSFVGRSLVPASQSVQELPRELELAEFEEGGSTRSDNDAMDDVFDDRRYVRRGGGKQRVSRDKGEGVSSFGRRSLVPASRLVNELPREIELAELEEGGESASSDDGSMDDTFDDRRRSRNKRGSRASRDVRSSKRSARRSLPENGRRRKAGGSLEGEKSYYDGRKKKQSGNLLGKSRCRPIPYGEKGTYMLAHPNQRICPIMQRAR